MSAPLDSRRILSAVALAALLLTSGCARKATGPKLEPAGQANSGAPVADSPEGLIHLFAWDLNHLDPDRYAELFTDDYQFKFGLSDSAGNFYRDSGMLRGDELVTARHLLIEGTATEPPARHVQLTVGAFIAYPDSRPGKTSPWHLEFRIPVTLVIDTGDQQFNVTGYARFFAVRGDSARIPADLAARGVGPDPHRWWIERWDDETGGGGYEGNAVENAMPTRSTTWGSIKVLYR